LDRGEIFSLHNNIRYGWSRDMKSMTRKRDLNSNSLEDGLIMFPPDEKSRWCIGKENKNCKPASWSIRVENGFYRVKVSCGDPSAIW